MPLEEQTTQFIKEETESVSRAGVRLTSQGVKALLQTFFKLTHAANHKIAQAIDHQKNTGKISLKKLNEKTHGATARLNLDYNQANQLVTQLKATGIDFHILRNKKDNTGILSFPAVSAPFVTDMLARIHPTMSKDEIRKTVMTAQQTAQELKNSNIEEPTEKSLTTEETKPRKTEDQDGTHGVQPDYWQTTPATNRQKELIHDQVTQGFIPETEAQKFLASQPTIAQANKFLNNHPDTVEHLDLYGKDNIENIKTRNKGAKLKKKDVQTAIKNGAKARGRAHKTSTHTLRQAKTPLVMKK